MIRGACILAVGFALGYAKALSEVPEAREFLEALKKEWAKMETEAEADETPDEPDEADKTNKSGKPGKTPKGETSQ